MIRTSLHNDIKWLEFRDIFIKDQCDISLENKNSLFLFASRSTMVTNLQDDDVVKGLRFMHTRHS